MGIGVNVLDESFARNGHFQYQANNIADSAITFKLLFPSLFNNKKENQRPIGHVAHLSNAEMLHL